MAEKFDEFLNGVENDIRQEKLLVLWKKYSKIITGILVILVVCITGYAYWGYYDQNKKLALAEKLSSAQELVAQGDMEKALTVLNTIAGANNQTYEGLALFEKAGILLQQDSKDKREEAIATYQRIAACKEVDLLWRDLASLLKIMAQMDVPDIQSQDLINELTPLTADQHPWRYFAREMKGTLFYRQGKVTEAAETYARLVQDNQTPPGISMRARLMVQLTSAKTPE